MEPTPPVPEHLHIDTTQGVTPETLLGALVELGVPPERLGQALAAVPATALLHVELGTPARGGLRIGGAPDTVLAGAEVFSQLAAAALPPGLRGRAEAALRARPDPAGPLSPAALGLVLAVSAAIEELAPETLSASPLPLPMEGRVPRAQDAQERPLPMEGRVPMSTDGRVSRAQEGQERPRAQDAQERPLPMEGRVPMSTDGQVSRAQEGQERPRAQDAQERPLPPPPRVPGHDRLLAQLRGALVRVTELPAAAVTPLGIALVRSLAEPLAAPPDLELSGHGVGRDADGTARVRVLAGRRTTDRHGSERLMLLETNLDDLQPELLATLIPNCLAAGAVDAWLTPVLMKKGRPAQVLSALCPPGSWRGVEAMLFRESSTLGVRRVEVARTALSRRLSPADTPWGPVMVKVGLAGGVAVNSAPEFEDCRRVAAAAGVPVKQVYAAAQAAARRLAAGLPPRSGTAAEGN